MHCPKIRVRKSSIPGAGYGVFAVQDISAGELLETAPFIEVPYQTVFSHNNNLLKDYVFISHMKPKHLLIVFGSGSMYNCSQQPNAMYTISKKDPTRMMDYYAIEPIKRGQEVLINYNRRSIN